MCYIHRMEEVKSHEYFKELKQFLDDFQQIHSMNAQVRTDIISIIIVNKISFSLSLNNPHPFPLCELIDWRDDLHTPVLNSIPLKGYTPTHKPTYYGCMRCWLSLIYIYLYIHSIWYCWYSQARARRERKLRQEAAKAKKRAEKKAAAATPAATGDSEDGEVEDDVVATTPVVEALDTTSSPSIISSGSSSMSFLDQISAMKKKS